MIRKLVKIDRMIEDLIEASNSSDDLNNLRSEGIATLEAISATLKKLYIENQENFEFAIKDASVDDLTPMNLDMARVIQGIYTESTIMYRPKISNPWREYPSELYDAK